MLDMSSCQVCVSRCTTAGEPLIDGENGDLIFVVKTQPHPHFQRRDNDLWLHANITLVEALTGFQREVGYQYSGN